MEADCLRLTTLRGSAVFQRYLTASALTPRAGGGAVGPAQGRDGISQAGVATAPSMPLVCPVTTGDVDFVRVVTIPVCFAENRAVIVF